MPPRRFKSPGALDDATGMGFRVRVAKMKEGG